MHAYEVHTHDTCEVHAYEVHACKIHVYEVHPLERKKKNLKGEDNDKTGIRTLEVCTRAIKTIFQTAKDKLDYQLLVFTRD